MSINAIDALKDCSFVQSGENVVVLGDKSRAYQLCSSLVETAKTQGKTVAFVFSDTTMGNTKPTSPEVTADLLFIWELPQHEPPHIYFSGEWTPGKALCNILIQRAELGKATLIGSSDTPQDWVRFNMLGSNTFWLAGHIGMGFLLNQFDPSRQAIFERLTIPTDVDSQRFFNRYQVALRSWIRCQHLEKELFQPEGIPKTCHWVDFPVDPLT